MITISEALVATLVERDDVDGTNAIQLLNNAQTNVLNFLYPAGASVSPQERMHMLHTPMDENQVDGIIIQASQNGGKDLFRF